MRPSAKSFIPAEDTLLRPWQRTDWNYITATWKHSAAEERHPLVSKHDLMASVQYLAEKLALARDHRISVCCDPDDSDFIYGWACAGDKELHYLFVRQSFRGLGIARHIVEGLKLPAPIRCTWWNMAAEDYDDRRPGSIVYRPSEITPLVRRAARECRSNHGSYA